MKTHIYTAAELLGKLRRGAQIAEVIQTGSGRAAERVVVRFADGDTARTSWKAVLEAEKADTPDALHA